ncbi:hypothetical protein [Pseudarthrobacter sp. fls2-241-R2A-168]|uniref:hypothetical protein n=1 Tax=Pseudarthrobacter sp. fls2-241-R2A-168 TaxID=3040304 RepID=UPI002553B279|nr:hypothetical protein [Pseudarthrobacter sp. fls2-241-R2A-168]
MGIAVLGATGGTAPAFAAPDTYPPGALICHVTEAGSYEPFFVSVHGMIHDLNGHGSHTGDIIPFPGFGGNPAGQNMTPENVSIYNAGCVEATVARVGPVVPVSPAAPAKVPASTSTNLGYNVNGAVQGHPDRAESGHANFTWLIGASALVAGTGMGILWRTRIRAKKVVG